VVSAKETEDKPFQLFRVAYPNGDILRLTNGLDNYVGVSVTADHNSLVSARRELRAVSGSSTKMASVPGSLHVNQCRRRAARVGMARFAPALVRDRCC